MVVAKQRHHALVSLLTGKLVFRVQRDCAAAFVVDVDQFTQRAARINRAGDGGCRAQAQIGLHFSHCQLDRTIAKNLQHQCAIELDVTLHQCAGGGHFAQQVHHLHRVSASSLPAL